MVSWLFCFLCFTSFVCLAGSDIEDGPEIHLTGHFRIDFGLFFKASPGACFSKVPKTFRARKAIRETPTCLICKAGLFTCLYREQKSK